MRNVTIRPQVTLTLTADDWQLYGEDGESERELAAGALNRRVQEAINSAPDAATAAREAQKVLSVFSKWGAADTEGYAVLSSILEAAYPGVYA